MEYTIEEKGILDLMGRTDFRNLSIIGETLCKSAYNYNAYWNPSATHILPHTIIEAGYEIVNVDLIGKSVELKKNK